MLKTSPFRTTMPAHVMLLTASLALTAATRDARALQSSGHGEVAHVDAVLEGEDCHSISELTAKEACFAGVGEELIARCEALRANACKPYRDVHRAERRLRDLGAEMLAINRRRFAAYVESDPAYLDDLGTLASAADEAWRAWRDAACSLEPFADGMSRRETSDLTEACRAHWTEQRVSEIDSKIQELEQVRE